MSSSETETTYIFLFFLFIGDHFSSYIPHPPERRKKIFILKNFFFFLCLTHEGVSNKMTCNVSKKKQNSIKNSVCCEAKILQINQNYLLYFLKFFLNALLALIFFFYCKLHFSQFTKFAAIALLTIDYGSLDCTSCNRVVFHCANTVSMSTCFEVMNLLN